MNYYYLSGPGATVGPVSAEELRKLRSESKIEADTYVIREGDEQWQRFDDFFHLDAWTPPPAPPISPRQAVQKTVSAGRKVIGVLFSILCLVCVILLVKMQLRKWFGIGGATTIAEFGLFWITLAGSLVLHWAGADSESETSDSRKEQDGSGKDV